MPASVQELIAANEHNSPFARLAQGFQQGVGQGIQMYPQMVEMQAEKAAMARATAMDMLIRQQMKGADESQTVNSFNAVAPPSKHATASDRLMQVLSDKGASVLAGDFTDLTPSTSPATIKAAKPAKAELDMSTVKVDPKTHLFTAEFKDNKPKPKVMNQFEYKDAPGANGVNRLGNYDPNTGERKTSPNDPLAPAKASDAAQGLREDHFYTKEYDGLMGKLNPDIATSRTAVGILGRANTNATRIMAVANMPITTNQDLGALIHDLAQIYAGGAATTQGVEQLNYTSAQQKVMGMMQYMTGKPKDAVPPEIKQHVIDMTKQLIAGNTMQIRQGLDRADKAYHNVLHHPLNEQQWMDFRKQWENPNISDPSAPPPMQNGDSRMIQLPSGRTFKITAKGS